MRQFLKQRRLSPVEAGKFAEEALSIVHAEDESEGGRITFDFDPEAEEALIELHRDLFDACPRAEAAVLYKLAMRSVRSRRRRLARDYLARVLRLDPGHKKARTLARLMRLGLAPLLPHLLRLRWKFLLATGKVK